MKINHIVADLGYCKELKELGVVQKSIFVWVKDVDGYFPNYMKGEEIPFRNGKEPFLECSAWTASELICVLRNIKSARINIRTVDFNFNSPLTYVVESIVTYTSDLKLENALAKMLILILKEGLPLIKNNIISLEEVNSNL